MKKLYNILFVLILSLLMSSTTLAQNRVAVDKDGNIQRTFSKKSSSGTVDISKILKPEQSKTHSQTKKPKAKPAASKSDQQQEAIERQQSKEPDHKDKFSSREERATEYMQPVNVYNDVDSVAVDEDEPEWVIKTVQEDEDNKLFEESYHELEEYIINGVLNSFQSNMVDVQGGTFEMGKTKEQGADARENEKPKHKVSVNSFKISKYEVTQAQWMVIMGNNPSDDKDDLSKPVTNVSYRDVMEFIQKLNERTGLNFRLPTEPEWEYAARGGHRVHGNTCYKYSGADNPMETAWTNDNSNRAIHPVGGLYPNELGLYDMSGNVMEWCADRFQDYDSKHSKDNYSFYSGDNYVCRGGSAIDDPIECRVSSRNSVGENEARSFTGFRLAM